MTHFALTEPCLILASTERNRTWLGNSLGLTFSSCRLRRHFPVAVSFSAKAILNSLLPFTFWDSPNMRSSLVAMPFWLSLVLQEVADARIQQLPAAQLDRC
jgi:hypothetical protein